MADISSVLTAALPVAGSLITTSMKNDTTAEVAKQKSEAAEELARQKAEAAAAAEKQAAEEAAAETQAARDAAATTYANTLKQKRDSDAADYSDATEDSAARISGYQQAFEADEADRQAALAKALASARARLGAGGVGAGDGSAAAVLDGLTSDAARESAEAASALEIKKKAENDALNQLRSKNLLDESQLEEKQRLELLAKYG